MRIKSNITLKTNRKRQFTIKDTGLTPYQIRRLLNEGKIEIVGTVQTGKRGRPMYLFTRVRNDL